MQIKSPLRFHLMPVGMTKINKTMTAHTWKETESGEQLSIAAGSVNLTASMEISVAHPQEKEGRSSSRSSYSTIGNTPKGCLIPPHVHCCSIHNR